MALKVMSCCTCLAKALPIMPMPPTGWNMVVCISWFMKKAMFFHTWEFSTSWKEKSCDGIGSPLTPPPGGRS